MLSSWCKMGRGKVGGLAAGVRELDWGDPAAAGSGGSQLFFHGALGGGSHPGHGMPWAGIPQAGKCLPGCPERAEPCPQSSSGQPHIGAQPGRAPSGTAPRGLWLLQNWHLEHGLWVTLCPWRVRGPPSAPSAPLGSAPVAPSKVRDSCSPWDLSSQAASKDALCILGAQGLTESPAQTAFWGHIIGQSTLKQRL